MPGLVPPGSQRDLGLRSLERPEYKKLNAAGLLDIRCSGARCEFVISNYKIEIIILLVSFLIFVAIVTMHLLDM